MSALDTSFTTDTIFRVERGELGFSLRPERVDPPLRKTFPPVSPELSDGLFVASAAGQIVGFAELAFETWNGRARIEHIYISPGHRGLGAGRALIRAMHDRARRDRTRREGSARCLWLETQNVNYPAVRFYQRMGFRLCGLDDTLYRADDPLLLPGEIALYFTRDLDAPP